MTDEQVVLARRAVACKGWRWMPGMRTLPTPTVLSFRIAGSEFPYLRALEDSLPDLTDPATVGCLLALVREAWGDSSLSVLFDHDGCKWRVGRWEDDGLALRCRCADTETEALVAALEKAHECP